MAGSPLKLVVITPETKVVDTPADSLRFPLTDGSIGVLPGRAPLIARLGAGELVVSTAGVEQVYYVENGFVQINDSTVSLLTDYCRLASGLSVDDAEKALARAEAREAASSDEKELVMNARRTAKRRLLTAKKYASRA
jgi:F-type H+-transporting ATPase subunit epsilon